MTIKFKNRLVFILIFISMALIISAIVASGISLYLGRIAFPEPEKLDFLYLQNITIFRFHLAFVFVSVFVILIYSLVSLIVVGIEFEKSQSTEIIFFTFFLAGCFFESARLFFPLLDLWKTEESVAVLATRLVLFGRTISAVSLFFSAIYSKTEYRQYVEKNILIIFVVALIFAVIYPLNTSVISPEGRYGWGLSYLFKGAHHGILLLAFLSLLLESIKNRTNYRLPLGMILISGGYCVLFSAYNIFYTALGAASLFAGTFLYLSKLHSIYLWND